MRSAVPQTDGNRSKVLSLGRCRLVRIVEKPRISQRRVVVLDEIVRRIGDRDRYHDEIGSSINCVVREIATLSLDH